MEGYCTSIRYNQLYEQSDVGTPKLTTELTPESKLTEQNAEDIPNAMQNLNNAIESTNPKPGARMPKFVSHVARRHA